MKRKMKIFPFFNRTCTVPGGSLLHPANSLDRPHPQPLRLALTSRVAYQVYEDDLAVVFSGIDRSVSTQHFSPEIIETICQREQIDPRAWSFFNLLTMRHSFSLQDGDSEYVAIMLQVIEPPRTMVGNIPLLGPTGRKIVIQGCVPVDCPEIVYCDFEDYIEYLHDPDDPAFPPLESDSPVDGERGE